MFFKALLLGTLFFLQSASAVDHQYYFKADDWQKGVHLFGGVGVNGSVNRYDFRRQDTGLGLNFKTDVGYFFNSHFAWEVGSNVKFNWIDDFMIWDTLLTTGFRYRFKKFPFTKSKGVYTRLFAGRAPTVIYGENGPAVFRRSESSRIQYDGPVYGFALGNMYNGKNNTVWFLEYGLSYQQLERSEGVSVSEDVPETTFESTRKNQIKIFSAYVNIGILVF